MRKSLVVAPLLVHCISAAATTQEPEFFHDGAQELPLLTQPLDQDTAIYWRVKLAIDDITGSRSSRTSLDRRYRAHWKIDGGRLKLTQIDVAVGLEWTALPLQRIFPGAQAGAIDAIWFTGDLVIGEGSERPCDPPRFDVCFDLYRVISVTKGNVENVVYSKDINRSGKP